MPIVFGAWVAEALLGGGVAAILRVIGVQVLRLLGIKALLAAMWVSLWAMIVWFGKTILIWFVDLAFWMLGQAMDALNFPDVMKDLLTAIDGMPANTIEFLVMVGVFKHINLWISCYFANRGLRVVPIVGRAFGG